MTMFSGDEAYDDDVTSGPYDHTIKPSIDGPTLALRELDDDEWEPFDDDLAGEFDDVAQGRYDFE